MKQLVSEKRTELSKERNGHLNKKHVWLNRKLTTTREILKTNE